MTRIPPTGLLGKKLNKVATYETITFQSKLENIATRQDKNGNPYLLLLTEKGNVFCFSTRIGQAK